MAIFAFAACAMAEPAQVPGVEPETRTIALRQNWTREELKAVYKIGGVYQPEAMARINHLLRDWRCGKTIDIDPKLVDLLYDLHQALGGRGSIRVISAYRSEGYNASLLRAGRTVDPNSQHMQGHAADIFFPGIRGDVVRAAAVNLGVGGVGHYPFSWPSFVHVDTGPVRQWVEIDPKVRRAMHLAAPRHKRFRLDCALTMASVFGEIPQDEAVAALPPGAAVSAETGPNTVLAGSEPPQTGSVAKQRFCPVPEPLQAIAALSMPKVMASLHRVPKKVMRRIMKRKRHARRHRT